MVARLKRAGVSLAERMSEAQTETRAEYALGKNRHATLLVSRLDQPTNHSHTDEKNEKAQRPQAGADI